ncbi:hypothetical protein LCGC14_0487300 [marine sediment metagenome]|uniref:Uncharacterized protein n=1 Tax=marine sediment metagenome TaxID=412755 RepID=A0A0F9UUP5_9ZZZZ
MRSGIPISWGAIFEECFPNDKSMTRLDFVAEATKVDSGEDATKELKGIVLGRQMDRSRAGIADHRIKIGKPRNGE